MLYDPTLLQNMQSEMTLVVHMGFIDDHNGKRATGGCCQRGANHAFFGPPSAFPMSAPKYDNTHQRPDAGEAGQRVAGNAPRSLTPRMRSSLPRICGFGIALPDSYSCSTPGFSLIFCAVSFCDRPFSMRAVWIACTRHIQSVARELREREREREAVPCRRRGRPWLAGRPRSRGRASLCAGGRCPGAPCSHPR